MEQLKIDVDLLRTHNLMDYSILISVQISTLDEDVKSNEKKQIIEKGMKKEAREKRRKRERNEKRRKEKRKREKREKRDTRERREEKKRKTRKKEFFFDFFVKDEKNNKEKGIVAEDKDFIGIHKPIYGIDNEVFYFGLIDCFTSYEFVFSLIF